MHNPLLQGVVYLDNFYGNMGKDAVQQFLNFCGSEQK